MTSTSTPTGDRRASLKLRQGSRSNLFFMDPSTKDLNSSGDSTTSPVLPTRNSRRRTSITVEINEDGSRTLYETDAFCPQESILPNVGEISPDALPYEEKPKTPTSAGRTFLPLIDGRRKSVDLRRTDSTDGTSKRRMTMVADLRGSEQKKEPLTAKGSLGRKEEDTKDDRTKELLSKLSAGDHWVVTDTGEFKLMPPPPPAPDEEAEDAGEKLAEKDDDDRSDSSGCASATEQQLQAALDRCYILKTSAGDVTVCERIQKTPPEEKEANPEKSEKQRSEKVEEKDKDKPKKKKSETKEPKLKDGKAAENEVWTKSLRDEIATLAVKIGKNGGFMKLEPYRERLTQEALETETLSQLQELHFRLEAIERGL